MKNWLTVCVVVFNVALTTGSQNQSSTNSILSRNKRGAPAVIATFAIEQLASIAINEIFNHLDGDQDEEVINLLHTAIAIIQDNFEKSFKSIEDLKDLFTVSQARTIELELQQFPKRLDNILMAIGRLSGDADQRALLEADIDRFNTDVKDIPDLLSQLHAVVVGTSAVGGNRLSGLACEYVYYKDRERTELDPDFNITYTIGVIHQYRDKIIELQVNSFQIYNGTCSSSDLLCEQNGVQLEEQLQAQLARFVECVPRQLTHLGENNDLEDVYIVRPSDNGVLYTSQITSIIEGDDAAEWNEVSRPKAQGVKCTTGNDDEIWTFERGVDDGRKGYYLKQKTGCYLSFDREFINYERPVILDWTKNDRTDKRTFLICVPLKSHDALSFIIYANSSDYHSSYILRDESTLMYLGVTTVKTRYYQEVDRRLVLTNMLSWDETSSWLLVNVGEFNNLCTDAGGAVLDGVYDASLISLVVILPIMLCCCGCCCSYCCYACWCQDDKKVRDQEPSRRPNPPQRSSSPPRQVHVNRPPPTRVDRIPQRSHHPQQGQTEYIRPQRSHHPQQGHTEHIIPQRSHHPQQGHTEHIRLGAPQRSHHPHQLMPPPRYDEPYVVPRGLRGHYTWEYMDMD